MQTIVNYIANALQARIPRIKIDTANDAATAHLTIPNKHGGKPINILAKAHAGIVVVFNKTPRLFDQDAKGIDKLAFDISEYLKGRSVYLDLLKSDGSDSGKDCIANSIEVQAENFTILTNLITRKGLLDSTELEKALQEGDIVRVNYWDPRKNYGYRLDGDHLAKIALFLTSADFQATKEDKTEALVIIPRNTFSSSTTASGKAALAAKGTISATGASRSLTWSTSRMIASLKVFFPSRTAKAPSRVTIPMKFI